MKGRFDDTVHFNIESDADSQFLKEEVRRVATKLIGQFVNTPSQQQKISKGLNGNYQSSPVHTEPAPRKSKTTK